MDRSGISSDIYMKREEFSNFEEVEGLRRVIDGKIYDTDTATWLCTVRLGGTRSDFGWEVSSLYKTPRGNFFKAGKGGPASAYRCPGDTGGWTPGFGIIPIAREDALEFYQRHFPDSPKSIEKHFGDMLEEA